MPFTPVTITHDFDLPDQTGALGVVECVLVEPMRNGGVSVSATPVRRTLAANGALSIPVKATTDPGTTPPGVHYRVVVRITGQPTRTYYTPVPHNLGPTIDLADLLAGVGGGLGGGGGGIAAKPVDLVNELGTLTPDATKGYGPHRYDATTDIALASPIGGSDGQPLEVQIYASGGTRVLSLPDGLGTVSIAAGTTWWGRFSYKASRDQWLLDDAFGGGTGGGTSYTDEQVDDRVNALIVAGANMTKTYDDAAGTLTLAAATTGSSGIPAATVDAKGDLLAGTANDTVARLPVGATGQVLTVSPAAATGLAWANPATPTLNTAGGGDVTQRIGWISYVYPTLSGTQGNYWDRALQYSPVVDIAIMNIGATGGPGTAVNSDWAAALSKAQASGCTVIGYVDSNRTARTTSTVLAEIDTWRSFYPTLDGIFIDQASIAVGDVGYYQTVYNHVKNTFPVSGRRLVAINPGGVTDEAYMTTADIIMTAEGDPALYRARPTVAWERKYPANRFWHAVYGISSLAELAEMIALSRARRAGYVYFTDDALSPNPWDTVPNDPFWRTQVAAISRGAAEDAGNNAQLAATLQVLVYSGGAYPARPAGLPGGQVRYIGPVAPSDWLDNDEWVNNS